MRAINRNDAFAEAYTRPSISIVDRFNPFGSSDSFEALYKYFQKKVRLQNDTTTSITTLTVRAYTAEDAKKFNEQLLRLSETTVNRLNRRGREDLIRYSRDEVGEAKAQSLQAALALAAYRNRIGVVDPEKQATAQMQMVTKLQDGLIAAKTELAQLQRFTPDNPRIPVVRTPIGDDPGRDRSRAWQGRRQSRIARRQCRALPAADAGKPVCRQATGRGARLAMSRRAARRCASRPMSSASSSPTCPTRRSSRAACAASSRRLRSAWSPMASCACCSPECENMPNNDPARRRRSATCFTRRSWTINRRVIGALLMREMLTRYGRNNIGFLWLFVEPMLFTLVITAFWTATRSIHGSAIPIVAFALTGYSVAAPVAQHAQAAASAR